jgi:hypothetical protein
MRLHERFEWDLKKAQGNRKKHRVTFDDAAATLADDEGDVYHVEEADDEHSTGEDRYITTGSHPDDRRIVLVIAWTERIRKKERITRIISARAATPEEKKRYVEEIKDQ